METALLDLDKLLNIRRLCVSEKCGTLTIHDYWRSRDNLTELTVFAVRLRQKPLLALTSKTLVKELEGKSLRPIFLSLQVVSYEQELSPFCGIEQSSSP